MTPSRGITIYSCPVRQASRIFRARQSYARGACTPECTKWAFMAPVNIEGSFTVGMTWRYGSPASG